MTSVGELDVYEIAYLCGGAERVALAAVVAMQQDRRIAISRTRHRVQAARRRASQPVECAVLDAVSGTGNVLGQLLHVKVSRERRVAVLGASGIGDDGLRDIFETPDPPPGGKLLPKARKTAGT